MNEGKGRVRYKITYLGMQAEGDRRKMAFVLAKLFDISPNEGLQRLKKAPFLLKGEVFFVSEF